MMECPQFSSCFGTTCALLQYCDIDFHDAALVLSDFSDLFYNRLDTLSRSYQTYTPVFTCNVPLGARCSVHCFLPDPCGLCICACTSHLHLLLCVVPSCRYWMWPLAPLPAQYQGVLFSFTECSGGHKCSIRSVSVRLKFNLKSFLLIRQPQPLNSNQAPSRNSSKKKKLPFNR